MFPFLALQSQKTCQTLLDFRTHRCFDKTSSPREGVRSTEIEARSPTPQAAVVRGAVGPRRRSRYMQVKALEARHGATHVSPCSGAPARRPARLPVSRPASARTPRPAASTQQRVGARVCSISSFGALPPTASATPSTPDAPGTAGPARTLAITPSEPRPRSRALAIAFAAYAVQPPRPSARPTSFGRVPSHKPSWSAGDAVRPADLVVAFAVNPSSTVSATGTTTHASSLPALVAAVAVNARTTGTTNGTATPVGALA
jgi:hypothetical protein